jgi:hypothetical protein
MGALRFQKSTDGPFLDNDPHFSAPPWASLRDLEFASLAIEKENASEQSDYEKWLKMLIAPGGSLGERGRRPALLMNMGPCGSPSFRDVQMLLMLGHGKWLCTGLPGRLAFACRKQELASLRVPITPLW